MSSSTNISMEYKYTVEMTYLDIVNGSSTEIKNECVHSLIIDHNYDENVMPIIYANMRLDKSLIDNMILNANTNMMVIAVYKYDNLTDDKSQVLSFRKKFTYFLPNQVNENDDIDYTDENIEETDNNTYGDAMMGFLCVDHINNNKHHCQLNVKGNSNFDCVKYVTDHMSNLVIEPFTYSTDFDQLIMPPQDSVNKALQWLNDNRVFYNTPFRFYQDFNYSYITSSAGRAIERRDETYSTILISIKEITDDSANDAGVIDNKSSQTYEVPVSYANVQVYDNTIANKSRDKLYGISSTGLQQISLKTSADYLTDKIQSIRLNNDNYNMMYNLEHYGNSQQIVVYVSKTGVDTDLFSINKRITIHFIDRYQQYDGVYLLFRKRDCYIREDTDFELITMLNLKKLESEENL